MNGLWKDFQSCRCLNKITSLGFEILLCILQDEKNFYNQMNQITLHQKNKTKNQKVSKLTQLVKTTRHQLWCLMLSFKRLRRRRKCKFSMSIMETLHRSSTWSLFMKKECLENLEIKRIIDTSKRKQFLRKLLSSWGKITWMILSLKQTTHKKLGFIKVNKKEENLTLLRKCLISKTSLMMSKLIKFNL